jgi:hypothetical protein
MSDNVVHLRISHVMARRLRMAKARERWPSMFESPPVPVKKERAPRRKKNTRGPTPSYGLDVLVIDSDGRRYPPMVHRQMVAALVLAELLKQHDGIELRRTPCGISLWRVRQDRPMTDRMIGAAIRETKSIIFCKNGSRLMGRLPVWLANAVRLAVFDRPSKKEAPLQK